MRRRFKNNPDIDTASVEQIHEDLMRAGRQNIDEDELENAVHSSDAAALLNRLLSDGSVEDDASYGAHDASEAHDTSSLLDELVESIDPARADAAAAQVPELPQATDITQIPDAFPKKNKKFKLPKIMRRVSTAQEVEHVESDYDEEQHQQDTVVSQLALDPHGLNNAESITERLKEPNDYMPAEIPDAASSLSLEGIEKGLTIIKHKRKRIWPLFIATATIFIVLTVVFVYVNRIIESEQNQIIAATDQEAQEYLDESIALIQNADTVIMALNTSYSKTITEDDIPKLEALIAQKDTVLTSLDQAAGKAQQAQETFVSEDGKSLAQHAYDATQLRKQMLEMNCEITNYDIAAMKDTITIDYVLSLVIEADSLMRQAVDAVSSSGADGIDDSLSFNQQAYDKLVLGEQALGAIHVDALNVNIQPLSDYLTAKKASVELAVASDQAFLDGDYSTYRAKTDEFGLKDEEAVALAANIPADPNTLVYTAYEAATSELKQQYEALVKQAADNDAYLRDYLGVVIDQPTSEPEETTESTTEN